MKVLWQQEAVCLSPLILSILLIINKNIKKLYFASIWAKAAYTLVYRQFSNSNAQSYPQK